MGITIYKWSNKEIVETNEIKKGTRQKRKLKKTTWLQFKKQTIIIYINK